MYLLGESHLPRSRRAVTIISRPSSLGLESAAYDTHMSSPDSHQPPTADRRRMLDLTDRTADRIEEGISPWLTGVS